MASNWNPVVAQQSLSESTLLKNVLPIKGNDTHVWLHPSARLVIQQVRTSNCIVRERSNSFRQPTSEVPIPPERLNHGLSCLSG